MQYWQFWLGLVGVLIMAGGLGGIFYLVIKQNVTIGNTTIKFMTIALVLPLLLVLGVVNVISRETVGPLVGVTIGYVLSTLGSRE